MTVLVEVSQAGNFSAAARRLNMSTTAVSRHVADLEENLGVTLLRRTTRHVSLTEAGARYLPRAAAILDEIERLNAAISAIDSTPRGKLKITAPPAIGHDFIAPLAVDFAEAYPQIELEMEFTERLVDLVAEGFDAAIRSGPLKSSSMIAHRIADIRYLLCASPSYLMRRCEPKRPQDISEHDCLHWRGATERGEWSFMKGGQRVSVPVQPRLLINDLEAERAAAVRGLGLAILPLFKVSGDLKAGRLVCVMPDYEVGYGELSLVRPPTPFEPSKLRVFIDFINAAMRKRARDDALVAPANAKSRVPG